MPTTETNRDTLHRLVDALPDEEIATAQHVLAALHAADPVLRALVTAPYDDESETDEERRAVEEARAEGEGIPHDEAMRQLGLR